MKHLSTLLYTFLMAVLGCNGLRCVTNIILSTRYANELYIYLCTLRSYPRYYARYANELYIYLCTLHSYPRYYTRYANQLYIYIYIYVYIHVTHLSQLTHMVCEYNKKNKKNFFCVCRGIHRARTIRRPLFSRMCFDHSPSSRELRGVRAAAGLAYS